MPSPPPSFIRVPARPPPRPAACRNLSTQIRCFQNGDYCHCSLRHIILYKKRRLAVYVSVCVVIYVRHSKMIIDYSSVALFVRQQGLQIRFYLTCMQQCSSRKYVTHMSTHTHAYTHMPSGSQGTSEDVGASAVIVNITSGEFMHI